MPPRLFIKFLRWYCDPGLVDHIEGDLFESYRHSLKKRGKLRADIKFMIEVVLLCRPRIIGRRKNRYSINRIDMLKHYFTIGWRNLLRNKGYSLINIGGLALGMTVAMLIGLWVYDEINFNHYYTNHERIAEVRVKVADRNTGEMRSHDAQPIPLYTAMKSNYSQYFKHILLAFWPGDFTLSIDDKKFTKGGQFIEGGALEMFSLNMIKGNYTSLNDPHSIVISQSAAKTFFGDEDPMGKNIKIDNRMDVVVQGVYEDMPDNTEYGHIQFFAPWSLWISSNSWVKEAETSWGNSSFLVYTELAEGVSMAAAEEGIKGLYIKYGPAEFLEDAKRLKVEVTLYPMDQWHLYSEFKDGVPSGGRIVFVWLFGIVGVFVLLLACINFMNLSTARSEKRAREVGVRKAIGSARSSLVQQFVSESLVVVLMAFVFSMILVVLALPLFNELAAKKLSLPVSSVWFWSSCLGFIIVTGLLASIYPAIYLSSFQPVKVLKGAFRANRFASLPRKVLVVMQFTVSITLIIGTVIVYQQIQFARNRPVGYDREGIISIPANDPNYGGKFEVLRNELMNTGVVSGMVTSSSPLTAVWNNLGGFNWQGKNPDSGSDFSSTNVSYDFGKTVGWEFISGRDFSRDMKTDSAAIVINETAARYLGFENPLGETITAPNWNRDIKYQWQIIGVIKDMVMTSPYSPEKRAFFFLDPNFNSASQIHVKIKPTESAQLAVPKIEEVFRKIVPSASFDYKFVDQQYAAKFSQEMRVGKLATIFAALAIFISCLGLFGLASFVAEQRTKEIGVRKVMGASVFRLWKMLSRDFVVLVIISAVASIPIATYFMNNWLRNFEYRINISWWIFAMAIVGALLVTLFTVSYQSIKAAKANPVKSLRSE